MLGINTQKKITGRQVPQVPTKKPIHIQKKLSQQIPGKIPKARA